jgi:hypothetical protein
MYGRIGWSTGSTPSRMTPWRLPTKWWRCVRRTSTRQKSPGKGAMSSVVYLSPVAKYHRLTRPTFTGAKRPRREGSHGLPAALSPLGTSSQPAVWTHGAGSGHLAVPLPTTPPCALLRWRRPRWYPQPPPLTSRPDPIREPRRHRGGPRRPWLRRAGAVGGHRLRQRLASAGMRQAKIR